MNTDKYKQVVSTHICKHFNDLDETESCTYDGVEGNSPESTQCQQLFWSQELLSINEDGAIEFDSFYFPSVCACHIIDDFIINKIGGK